MPNGSGRDRSFSNRRSRASWEAADPDGDALRFLIEIRQLGEADYRLIEQDWSESAYSLKTGFLPDGVYEIRVTASDHDHAVFGIRGRGAHC